MSYYEEAYSRSSEEELVKLFSQATNIEKMDAMKYVLRHGVLKEDSIRQMCSDDLHFDNSNDNPDSFRVVSDFELVQSDYESMMLAMGFTKSTFEKNYIEGCSTWRFFVDRWSIIAAIASRRISGSYLQTMSLSGMCNDSETFSYTGNVRSLFIQFSKHLFPSVKSRVNKTAAAKYGI